MHTLSDVRKRCAILNERRLNDVRLVVNDLFEYLMSKNARWRATTTTKNSRFFPIYKYFYATPGINERKPYQNYFHWPILPQEEIIEALSKLGFIVEVLSNKKFMKIRVSVPLYEKGKDLTFAQEWVKKINYNYSLYVESEKKHAVSIYNEFIEQLYNYDETLIQTSSTYSFFKGFKFDKDNEITKHCYKYIKKFMTRDGLVETFEYNLYTGILIMNETKPCNKIS